ncbi:hypothetical protein [uncultured Thiodictyon sp.]|jgi:hypothetical protein|uniref:hypothetical protein n=1 Tax=uncultured Thiodictyon sp. TaxID=1846217 RepID=UPI0025E4BA73|nr:hypothetical protein [uncultured Thiodictyon sp.]
MSTRKVFSEKERAYHVYQARRNYLRQECNNQRYMDEMRASAEEAWAAEEQARASEQQARAAEEAERAQKLAALAEVERLKKILQDRPPS